MPVRHHQYQNPVSSSQSNLVTTRTTSMDSECAALVRSSEGMSYTEEGGSMLHHHAARASTAGNSAADQPPHHDPGDDDLMDYVDSEIPVLAQFHEDAIRQAGFGYFQWMLALVIGLGLAADTIEVFVIAYIIPGAEVELCIDDAERGWLGAITFVGMMIGGVVWGNLADRMGRRRTLMSALGVNAVFSVIAALMPTYGTFMTARFCSAVGVGGAFPVVLAYFGEFLCKADRAKYLSWLLMFWALGGIFVVLIAWAVIPASGADVVQESNEHFSAWHQFLLLCSVPSLGAVIGLVFLPESPRYLLEAGREVEAMMVYQRVYKTNNMHNPAAHAQYQLSELELPSKRPAVRGLAAPPSPGKSVLADMTYSIEMFWNSFLQLFIPPHLRVTWVLVILWLTAAFGYYGLSVWFPEYIKHLKLLQYSDAAQTRTNENFTGFVFNSSLENIHWHDSNFSEGRFHHLVMNHVTFDNCSLENVEFANIKSSRTYFRDTLIKFSKFVDTDLSDQHFQNCQLVNVTVMSLAAGCQIDFDYNIHLEEVLQENLVRQLAILPGAFISGFILTKFGRVKYIGICMFLSSVAAFFIWFLDTAASVVAFEAVFSFIFICGWNTMNIATLESYPTHLRTTGFGFLFATCKLGGALGSATFRSLTTSSRAVPMLTAAAVLVIGGIVSVKLPESNSVLL